MDAFSEVLNGVRLKGAMFFSAAFSEPWRLSTPHCRELTLVPDPPHMVIYHLVVDGSARTHLEGDHDVELSLRFGRQQSSGFRERIRTLRRPTLPVAVPQSSGYRLRSASLSARMPSIQELFALDGQVAIVTGASRGLGEEMAEGLAEAGAALMICARRESG